VTAARAAQAGTAARRWLFDGSLAPVEQARGAVTELRVAARASAAVLAVTTAAGAPLVRVASKAEPEAGQRPGADVNPVILVRGAPQQYVAKIGLEFPPGAGPTRQDYRIAEMTADLIESWVPWAQAHGAGAERRAVPEAFANVLERAAGQVLARGKTVTFVLLSSQALAFHASVSRDQIALIRGHVRASDLVGLLADNEIGVLLGAHGAEQTSTVTDRLRHIVEDSLTISSHALRMAVVTRTPASPELDTLVHDARKAISPFA
jgi:hypothetical protein